MTEARVPVPLSGAQRTLFLDSLRGFALVGILFVNLTWFTGYAVLSAAQRDAFATAAVDGPVYFLVHVLVDGKFWSLFALIFGVGFAIQAELAKRTGDDFARRYARRMAGLLALGLLHAVFVWFGDIVSLYAVVGVWLLLFRRSSDATLLRWAVALLLSPVVLAALWLALDVLSRGSGAARVDPGHGPAALLGAFGGGTSLEVLRANWAFLVERWSLAIYTGRFPALLGMFLLGYLLGRNRVLREPESHGSTLRRLMLWGIGVGLPANVLAALIDAPLRPPSELGWIACLVRSVGTPALCLGYAAGFALLWRRSRRRRVALLLAPLGRMSLSNYFAQSLIGVGLFYGVGLGLWGRISITWSLVVIVGIVGVQSAASAWWLRRFSYGPVEWAWRRLTYGGPVRLQGATGQLR
jgi:uncharacterized protein